MDTNEGAQKGSVFGGILLVAGCCIGAGMLGLPVFSAVAGFEPSLLMLLLSWTFMVTTGLLLLEVNLWFANEVNIISMAGKTLGFWGKLVGWGGFLYLFYALMVAFISGSGELASDFFFENSGIRLPPAICGLALCFLFGVFLYLGTRAVDRFNRVMILGLGLSYVILVFTGFPHVDFTHLLYKDWKAATLVLPTMIISFGYHNLIPSLTTYLQRDVKKLRTIIIVGSALPLLIYALWMAVLLGIIPVDGEGGFRQALNAGEMATQTLRNAVGSTWVTTAMHYLAFFSIITTLLAVGLSFVDFLADGLRIKKDNKGKCLLCFLTLGPPFLFAVIYPKLFFTALNYAGGFGAVLLFGILPACMVWSGRYRLNKSAEARLVPGGKVVLGTVIAFALGIMVLQALELVNDLGY
jgi:tyrosine-specific transport protein